ncbi:MAG: hypothetical protein M3340_15215 [Actinomycetota bacterium]|nr:hypothetical protein [Actinomycetota bacterium]
MKRTAAVTDMRERRVSRAVAARRRLDRAPFPDRRRPRAGGRVWVNGVEVGGTDARHATVALGYD